MIVEELTKIILLLKIYIENLKETNNILNACRKRGTVWE